MANFNKPLITSSKIVPRFGARERIQYDIALLMHSRAAIRINIDFSIYVTEESKSKKASVRGENVYAICVHD